MKSTIRLFKALPITDGKTKVAPQMLLVETLRRGFVFSPEIFGNYDAAQLRDLIRVIEKEIGLTAERANSTFHKSWGKVSSTPIEQLIIEQLVHYFTTYGFEQLGIYSQDSVYIPNEELDIPDLREGIPIVVIRGYTKDKLREKITALLGSGIALGEDTIKDIIDVCLFVDIDAADLEKIKNKEVRIQLYDYLNVVPRSPAEFLRYLIYKAIDKTLLIKSKEVIEEIQAGANKPIIVGLFRKYNQKYGYKRLAEIFYRFKPLFLAFKANDRLKPIINKVRKLAITYHKPMPEDFLNTVTAKVAFGEINEKTLVAALGNANIFRKIRLAYALKYRTSGVDSILYRIRNGKAYADDFNFQKTELADKVLSTVMGSIVGDIGKKAGGKKIYIPEYMHYALPATEKQFTGYFPTGTYASIPKDMIFGVNWNNVRDWRVDLDLSLVGLDGKFGWDAYYRSQDKGILFSGDMTDAKGKNGATELFYIKRQSPASYIMFVNYYNYSAEYEVPFKILVAHEKTERLYKNYVVNPNNILAVAKTKINKKQMMLGLLVLTEEECKFYFAEASVGRNITSSSSPTTEKTRKYLVHSFTNGIDFNHFLGLAGAEVVTEKDGCDIDLSPEAIEKDTFLSLLA